MRNGGSRGGAADARRRLKDLEPLSEKEAELLSSWTLGSPVPTGQVRPDAPSPANIVRANFVRFLLLGGIDSAIKGSVFELTGAWVDEELKLASAHIESTLKFINCTFAQAINFADTNIRGSVVFKGCKAPGLDAQRISCTGDLWLREMQGCRHLFLRGARIGGDINCNGSSVSDIRAENAIVGGGVFLAGGFEASLAVFSGAKIEGSLFCNGARFPGRDGRAIQAHGATIGGDIFIGDGCSAGGSINFSAVRLGGNLDADKLVLTSSKEFALSAEGITIGGGFTCRESEINGTVRLTSAHITGTLNFNGSKLTGEHGDAFSADRSVIGGTVFLSKGFSASGKTRIVGAHIAGNLSLKGASLCVGAGASFAGDRACVDGNVYLSEGFASVGEIRLLGMRIGGSLSCADSTYENPNGVAVLADALVVEKSFFFRRMRKPVDGVILTGAKVGILVDDEISWGGGLILDGFTYGSIAAAPVDAAARLRWLDKQRADHSGLESVKDGFKPQPWRQLRQVLRQMGHFEDAREISIAYEERLRFAGLIGQSPAHRNPVSKEISRAASRAAHYIFGALIGYGYRPLRLVSWCVLVWLVCAALYWVAALQGVMAPSNPLVFQNEKYQDCATDRVINKTVIPANWYLCDQLPEEYTGFSPLAYSLDLILPLVDLQQERDWAPKVPTPSESWWKELTALSLKHIVRLVVWIEILFGWMASLLLVAVVSGLTKRVED
ncbi:hypothetical protein NX773_20820 [Massilia solisilvae]|uniref:Membrane-associated oxidoreductase n=1 Tax=Massilia solisilvae TaxID=1811225 RepID=A0ABT2BQ41_9BURK|nr:hypothetical protein [Massilia solisilvae]MCS0610619.1 hypothetical protein [Massilia solisilvae]